METKETNVTWENNPWIVKQIAPWAGLSEYYGALLLKLLGPPFFHWWILNELLQACKKQLPFYPARTRGPLAEVIVYIEQDSLMQASDIYGFASDRGIFLSTLSQWLTEQVQAYLASEDKALQWPLVHVMCCPARPEKNLPGIVYPENKEQVDHLITALFSSLTIKILNSVFFLRGKKALSDVSRTLECPFFFEFSDRQPFCTLELHLKVPLGGYIVPVKGPSFTIGLASFPGNNKISKNCILVSRQHVQISVVNYSSNRVSFFGRHIGEHETWVLENIVGTQDEEGGQTPPISVITKKGSEFELLSRDGWRLLPSRSLLILGRVVGDERLPSHKMILPGSMVIQIP